jgi:hypothetical protein
MDKQQVIKYVKTAVIIIVVPSAIVGAYYGYKYVKKKMGERAARKAGGVSADNVIDTTGMKSYLIKVPFKYQPDLFTSGKLYDSISKVKYSFISDKVNNDANKQPSEIVVEIMASPVDIQRIKAITEGLNKEIKVEEKH